MTLELFPTPAATPLDFELRAARRGFRAVAGVDEVGRGPLAGPVVAAAVILPPRFELPGLTDSKKLSPAAREALLPLIRRQALAIGIGVVSARQIEISNILQATLQAMALAVGRLRRPADFLLVDGISQVPLALPQQTLKQGDCRSLSIAAASVVAKVVRDRMMTGYARRYPGYGFEGHKGYGSAAHLAAIARLGPCELHRRTFAGVREHLEAR
ncbi:MAG: ribonuclease HII [Trichloromonadaceae bacterium]